MGQGTRARLRGIKVVVKPDGRRYVYRRVAGKLVPLPDLPETDDRFLAAYVKAGEAVPKKVQRAPGSVEALASRYQTSQAWKDLAPGTRAVRARILKHIVAKHGTQMIAGQRPRHVRADLADMDAVPANSRLKVWRALLAFGVAEGVIEANPASEVEPRRAHVTPHRPWGADEIAAYRAHWKTGTAQRMAFEVLYWSGARCSDAVRLGRQMVDDAGWLHFTQAKTGGDVSIPWSCALPSMWASLADDHAHLQACLRGHTGLLYILTGAGAPRSIKAMSQWLSASARKAGLAPEFTAHGLRKSRAIAITEIGGTPHQVGAWTGHMSLKEIEEYTRGANRRRILGFQRGS